MEDNKKYFMPTFEGFLNEISYDEQEGPPVSSFRSEDYKDKDNLRQSMTVIEELLRVISDGEQLDPEQSELISSVNDNLQKLKRSIQGREDIKSKEEEKREEEQGFGN